MQHKSESLALNKFGLIYAQIPLLTWCLGCFLAGEMCYLRRFEEQFQMQVADFAGRTYIGDTGAF